MKELETIHKKSILDCQTEEEYEIHAKEVEDFLCEVNKTPNRKCIFASLYLDDGHKHIQPRVEYGELHDFGDMIDGFDFKNGVDFSKYNGFPVATIYGQTYTLDGEYHMIIQRLIAV